MATRHFDEAELPDRDAVLPGAKSTRRNVRIMDVDGDTALYDAEGPDGAWIESDTTVGECSWV